MSERVSSVRDRIYERAKSLFVAEIAEDGGYMFPNMSAFSEYGGDKIMEPILPVDDFFDLGECAYATVNKYNAIVLNSRNLFIADIDFGDSRLNQFATVREAEEVLSNIRRLSELDEDLLVTYGWDNLEKLSRQAYWVYRTHSGCRVICTSMTFDRKDAIKEFLGDRLLRFLQSDPKYVELCKLQRSYRARLTAKPWRVTCGEPNHICDFIEAVGRGRIHPNLSGQLRFHDEMTLATKQGSALA